MKYRSVLFVPGHEEKKIRKAYTLNPDEGYFSSLVFIIVLPS